MTISVGGGTGPVLVSISLQNENRKIPGNIESETQRRKELKKYFNIYGKASEGYGDSFGIEMTNLWPGIYEPWIDCIINIYLAKATRPD